MFRTRLLLAMLVAVAILPLVGCTHGRCCGGSSSYAARPAYSAPCCPNSTAAPPVVVGQ
jgi:hypothetical protein